MSNMEDKLREKGFTSSSDNQRRDPKPYQQNVQQTSTPVNRGIDGSTDYDPIEEGKKLAERMKAEYERDSWKFKFSTSQLRKILAFAATVKNEIELEFHDENEVGYKISKNLQSEVQYIRLKLVYQMGREQAVKTWMSEKGVNVPEIINNIGDSKKRFDKFYRLLESIVAYKKFYIYEK